MSSLLQQVAEPQDHRTTFIYALVDPTTRFVRYVGKANNPKRRRFLHLNPSSLRPNTRKNNWIKGLLAIGKKPELLILEEVEECLWEAAEIRWISHYRNLTGAPELTNGTSGGDGAERGHRKSPETLQKLSLSLRGRKVSKETREKISRSNFGKKRTPEQREKIRVATEEARIRKFGPIKKKIEAKPARIPSSVFRGVSMNKHDFRWKAFVTVDGKYVSLGVFECELEAAHQHDLWVIENRGQDAYTNFPREIYEKSKYTAPSKKEIQKNNTSGYRGVSWFKKNQNWMVSAQHCGIKSHVGCFRDKVEAARAYDRWVIQHHGATAYTNFPRSDYQ